MPLVNAAGAASCAHEPQADLASAGRDRPLVVGVLWTYAGARGYEEKRVNAVAGACRVDMTIIQKRDAQALANPGAVVLFHVLAANKYIMRYLARGFAELGLTFTSKTFPGTGARPVHSLQRTQRIVHAHCCEDCRPRADRSGSHHTCRTLDGRGHRAAPCAGVSPRGVIALSPAPMKAAHGVSPKNCCFKIHHRSCRTP